MTLHWKGKRYQLQSELPPEEVAHRISDNYRDYLKTAFKAPAAGADTASSKPSFVIMENGENDNTFEMEIEGVSKTKYGNSTGVEITAVFVPSGSGTVIQLAIDYSRWFLGYIAFMVWVFMANLSAHFFLSVCVLGIGFYTVRGAITRFSKAVELAPGLLCSSLDASEVKA